MPEHPDVVQIKTELDIRRARIKKQFQEKIRKLESSLQGHREKIEVYKKKRDSDIARIEENFDRKTAVTIKRLLGEEKYGRLQQWLLEKKENELHRVEEEFQPTEEEDYDRQISRSQETDTKRLAWIYLLDNQGRFREELKRDIGIEL